jgi:hypothetical protein
MQLVFFGSHAKSLASGMIYIREPEHKYLTKNFKLHKSSSLENSAIVLHVDGDCEKGFLDPLPTGISLKDSLFDLYFILQSFFFIYILAFNFYIKKQHSSPPESSNLKCRNA